MGVCSFSVAAATAVVGYDLLESGAAQTRFARMSGVDRVITSLALCGSAAAGDTEVEVYVEDTYYGNFYNITTGYPTKDHAVACEIPVPAGAQVRVVVRDAASTNPINGILTTTDLPVGTLQ